MHAPDAAGWIRNTTHDLVDMYRSNPTLWLCVLGGLLLWFVLWRIARRAGDQLDPCRAFSTAQRIVGFRRAGNRCEHKLWFWFRCTVAPAHGDHIYPWSRGGSTSMANLQVLCQKHNLAKSDHVPGRFYLLRLERRRRRYFPAGEPVEVQWRVGVRP